MGVAGPFFEPHSCNFGKLDIFLLCLNDISTIFWNFSWGQTYQKCLEPMGPDNTKVHALVCSLKFKDRINNSLKKMIKDEFQKQHLLVMLSTVNLSIRLRKKLQLYMTK